MNIVLSHSKKEKHREDAHNIHAKLICDLFNEMIHLMDDDREPIDLSFCVLKCFSK